MFRLCGAKKNRQDSYAFLGMVLVTILIARFLIADQAVGAFEVSTLLLGALAIIDALHSKH